MAIKERDMGNKQKPQLKVSYFDSDNKFVEKRRAFVPSNKSDYRLVLNAKDLFVELTSEAVHDIVLAWAKEYPNSCVWDEVSKVRSLR